MKQFSTSSLINAGLLTTFLFFSACSDDEDSSPSGDDAPDYREAVGSSANELLSDNEYEHLIVELVFVDDYKPTEDAIESFENFMESRLNKETIEVIEGAVVDEGSNYVQDEYSTSDIRNLEDEYRSEFPREDTMAAFMVFLNGNSERDDDNARILGLAYNNTSMAVFQETVEDVSGDGVTAPSRNRVEKTVINHEMGHILGLVDNGTPMQEDHKDEDRGAHCDNEDCLMYYTMKRDDLIGILLGGSDPELDENCINDLQANGGK